MKTTQIMPQAPDVEKTVLASLVISPDLISDTLEVLNPDCFYTPVNQTIYKALAELHKAGSDIDVQILSDYLKSSGLLDVVGGEVYLCELYDNIATTPNIKEYSRILLDKAMRRRTIADCNAIVLQARNEGTTPDTIAAKLSETSERIAGLCDMAGAERVRRGHLVTLAEVQSSIEDEYDNGIFDYGNDPGWPSLKNYYRPAKKYLNVVTGIPSHGKSEFMDALMVNLAQKPGWKWAIFSPENFPYQRHAEKLLKKLLGQPVFGNGRMSKESMCAGMEWLNEHFYFIEPHENNLTIDAILTLAKEAVEKYQIDGLVIDPWNEMEVVTRGNESETDYIGRALMRCRRFARKYNVAFYIVAHPAKLYKDKNDKYPVPRLYDISGSQHWANKSDNGLTVWRNYESDTVDIHVQKIRFSNYGKVGVVTLRYNRDNGRLEENF